MSYPKQAIWHLLAQGISVAGTALFWILVANIGLSAAEIGSSVGLLSAAFILAYIGVFGSNTALLRELSVHKKSKLLNSAIASSLLILCILHIVGLFTPYASIVPLLFVVSSALAIDYILQSSAVALEQTNTITNKNLLQLLLRTIFVIVYTQQPVIALVYGMGASTWLANLYQLALLHQRTGYRMRSANPFIIYQQGGTLAFYSFAIGGIALIQQRIIPLLLASIDPAITAVYFFCNMIAQGLHMIPTAFSTTIFPYLAKKKDMVRHAQGYGLLLTLPLALLVGLSAQPLLGLFGEVYAEHAAILQILVTGSVLYAWYGPLTSRLNSQHQEKYSLIASMLGMAAYLYLLWDVRDIEQVAWSVVIVLALLAIYYTVVSWLVFKREISPLARKYQCHITGDIYTGLKWKHLGTRVVALGTPTSKLYGALRLFSDTLGLQDLSAWSEAHYRRTYSKETRWPLFCTYIIKKERIPHVALLVHPAHQKGGITTYSRNLHAGLIGNVGVELIEVPHLYRDFLSTLWRLWRSRATIIHATSIQLGVYGLFVKGKKLVTVHDMGLYGCSEDKGELTQNARTRLWIKAGMMALRRADKIISDSSFTQNELHKYLGVHSEVVPLGVGSVQKREKEPSRVRLLYVGAERRRKNLEIIPWILKELEKNHPNIQFIKVGKPGWEEGRNLFLEQMRKAGVAHLITFADEVEDVEDYYLDSSILLFPSKYEGFGLPLLEAMAHGCVVVTSDRASIPEVVADAAITHKADDIEGYVKSIEKLITDKKFYKQMQKKGYARAQAMQWDHCAENTLEVYKKLW